MAYGFQVTFDAHHPVDLAEFWALALGYVIQPPPEGYGSWEDFADAHGIPLDRRGEISAIVDPDGGGPRVLFLRVPESKLTKNRVHLDISVGHDHDDPHAAVEAHVATLVRAGATYVKRFEEPTGFWVVCQDPEGNEFCVQ